MGMGVTIYKLHEWMWKTNGFRFGKWSTNSGFSKSILVYRRGTLQQTNVYMCFPMKNDIHFVDFPHHEDDA